VTSSGIADAARKGNRPWPLVFMLVEEAAARFEMAARGQVGLLLPTLPIRPPAWPADYRYGADHKHLPQIAVAGFGDAAKAAPCRRLSSAAVQARSGLRDSAWI
jgi:hypothetical protein